MRSLEKAVRDSEALARLSPENPEYLPEPSPQTYPDVSGYYSSTGDLTTEDRGRAASLVLERSKAAGTIAAGFIDVFAGSQAVANQQRPLRVSRVHGRRFDADGPHARRLFVGMGGRRRRGLDHDRIGADCHRGAGEMPGVAR